MKKCLVFISFISSFYLSSAQTHKGAIAIGGQVGLSISNTANSYNPNTSSSYTTTSYRSTNIKFIPDVSYFLSEKFALGIGIGYNTTQGMQTVLVTNNNMYPLSPSPYYYSNPSFANSSKEFKLKNHNNMVVINPYVKYYIKLSEKAYISLKGNIDLGFGENSSEQLTSVPVGVNSPSEYYPYQTVITDYRVEKGAKNNISNYGVGIQPSFVFFPSEKWAVELSLGGNLLGYSISNVKYGNNQYGGPVYNDYSYYPYAGYYGPGNEKVTTSKFDFFDLSTKGLALSLYYFIK